MIPFAIIYLNECEFSALVTMKTMYLEGEMRLNHLSIPHYLDKLCVDMLTQCSDYFSYFFQKIIIYFIT